MIAPGLRVRWFDDTPPLELSPSATDPGLIECLARAGRPLNTRCGRRGLCAGCTVRLTAGRFVQNDGAVLTAPADIKICQGRFDLIPGAEIFVPARSLARHRPQVVSTFKLGVTAAQMPLVPSTPGQSDHGLAIDIGTTTVVVSLVELATGRIVTEASAFNRQIEFGDDVLTRIQQAILPGGREALRVAIVDRTLAPAIAQACAAAAIDPARLAAATVAANTTMLHLLTGVDPTPLGIAPFQAAFLDHRVVPAADLGLAALPPTLPVHLLPGFSAYVGADLVAGALCTGLLNEPGPTLLVDIGTNGEILLRHGARLYATATAAGPAFEGGRLARGTRAVAGAIAHLAFPAGAFPPTLELVPGRAQPVGICGSACIDFLALGRRIGLLGENGRFAADAWAALPPSHRHTGDDGRGILLRADEPASLVTEADLAQLLQAKAAIAAGILALLRRAGLAPADVKRLCLAGGFGLHLDVAHAIACGLLPGFAPAQVEVVGNTALGGAWLALVDAGVLPEMEAIATTADIVELNLEPGFEDTFIDQLLLP